MAQSNVGNPSLYEAGDQRNPPDSEKNKATPYEEGKENSHKDNDPKDERSIANRLEQAQPQNDDDSGKNKTAEQIAGEQDPLAPARMHGNEPSKGAKIDAEIQAEEEAEIARKDAAKADAKKAKKH